jgi:hypothetical protein
MKKFLMMTFMFMSFSFSASAAVKSQPIESDWVIQGKWVKLEQGGETFYIGDARYETEVNYDATTVDDPPKFYIEFWVKDNPNNEPGDETVLAWARCEKREIEIRTVWTKDKNGNLNRIDTLYRQRVFTEDKYTRIILDVLCP